MRLLFDAYWMVDWSARSEPVKGADSIWAALVRWSGGRAELEEPTNHPERSAFVDELVSALNGRMVAERVLLGFDFPFGYPAGLAATLGWTGADSGAAWRFVWDWLRREIADGPQNRNNRFEVAAAINAAATGGLGPFFGRPAQVTKEIAARLSTRYKGYFQYPVTTCAGTSVALARRTDECAGTTSSPWFLCGGANAVGGQALVGIPHLARIRDEVRGARVWPFEVGAEATLPEARVVLAEIYPSMFELGGEPSDVKDRRQVIAAARGFASLDASGILRQLLQAPSHCAPAIAEEGWVLGAEEG